MKVVVREGIEGEGERGRSNGWREGGRDLGRWMGRGRYTNEGGVAGGCKGG